MAVLALATLVVLSCSASSERDAAMARTAEALRTDAMLDLEIPESTPGEPVFSVGNADQGNTAVPFSAGRTWTVVDVDAGLPAEVARDAISRGLRVDAATCFPGNGGGVQLTGTKVLDDGTAGVVLTVQPLERSPQEVRLVMTASGADDEPVRLGSVPAVTPIDGCSDSLAESLREVLGGET